jgi:hypothetical protein
MNEDELIDIISSVTNLLGSTLAQHVELTETIAAGAGVESQRRKVAALKAKIADANLRLAKLKDRAKRKKELAKANQHKPATNEGKSTRSRVALLNGKGRWVGFVETLASGNVNIYDARGRIVSRELSGLTLDQNGRLFAKGRAGLVALGKKLAA